MRTSKPWLSVAASAVIVLVGTRVLSQDPVTPRGGALAGQRYRILVSTDLGGSDEDDMQSLVHLLIYADRFDIEGIISSPPGAGRRQDILNILDRYEQDYPNLRTHSRAYPSPDELRRVTRQGAFDPAPNQGWSTPTDGSRWIIRQAHRPDPRPLYVLVWGSITDVAQAVHDDPRIKDAIRVYFIASWNQRQDPAAPAYLGTFFPDLWMIHCDSTFRGWYMGGQQSDDLGNETFVREHVRGHGALGEFFYPLKSRRIKMGDTPSVAYLLRGDPDDPASPHWGGRFVPHPDGRPRGWVDDPDPAMAVDNRPGAKTVSQYRTQYLRDWQQRMDRAIQPAYTPGGLASARGNAPHRGVYEVRLQADPPHGNPYFDVALRVRFTRPDGSTVEVDGFFDGGNQFKARAYCDTIGTWQWRSEANLTALDALSGQFVVVPSSLKGKLRHHPTDPYQFAYDDGTWFLHLGDTGYRYVVATEPEWREYIDQAAAMGTTKIRTWFAQARSTVEIVFNQDRSALNLAYWQEIDRRLLYALAEHPDIQFQLIPYAEDTEELKRYHTGDPASQLVARYAQARWSALPNVFWCISNDREIVHGKRMTGRKIDRAIIERIGRDMAAREPWGTLLCNHQARRTGYDFVDAPWSDLVILEDLDQVTGSLILAYREKCQQPIVLDEDRYEHWRNPAHDRYFFRRLMWASLLSGGHATYGGLRTFEAYDGSPTRGVRGYFDACRAGVLQQGAHDFRHLHAFFRDAGITLVGLRPDDPQVGGDPRRWKCAHDQNTYIVYLANPSGDDPKMDAPALASPQVTLTIPEGRYVARWFDPSTGQWQDAGKMPGGRRTLKAPNRAPNGSGDWVLLIQRESGGP